MNTPARPEVHDYARTLVRGGFRSMGQIIDNVFDYFEDTITRAHAAAVVVYLWSERGAEQQTWSDITDPDRLTSAFDQLNANGVVARQDFACCRNCGFSEIDDEADDNSRGFVFFHQQDTDRAANGDGLLLAFGAFPDAPDTTESIGHEVVAALTEAGLVVVWNGDVNQRIEVNPLVWNKRLPK